MTRKIYSIATVIAVAAGLASCKTDPNSPGVEYMPDMYRSPALEAYVDYGTNKTMDLTTEMKEKKGYVAVQSRKPAPGTIPYVGAAMAPFVMPYPLANTPDDYERAAVEIKSPLQPAKEHIEKGIEIYGKMCVHCHGAEGHGDGLISSKGAIAGIPDYATKLKDLPEGKIFHSITYGKGLMGQHASQLNKLQRWQVTEWVKCLQQGITAPEFDENGLLKKPAAPAEATAPASDATAPAAPGN
jgi:mono/diheme cytochrome c family protein